MSELFEKNLSYIKKSNQSLYEKLVNTKEFTQDIQLNTNLAGEYNLLVDGMAVHAIAGAQQEAEDVFSKLPHNTNLTIHVLYGLGLGYLFDVFVQKAKGAIIVYEDNIELLRFVLEIADLSPYLERKDTYLVSDYSEFRTALYNVFHYRSKMTLSALDYYMQQKKETYNAFYKEAKRLLEMFDHNYSFQVHKIYSFLCYTVYKADEKFKLPLLTDYKDMLKDKPAVIVSAGPSLAKNVDVLKKYKDNAYIFCVGTALKTLINNGITPDFLNVIEKVNSTYHFSVPETKDMMLICEPYTNIAVVETEFKRKFITASEETDAARWFLETYGRDELVPFETKGTVSYHALSCAKYLGCNPIILIGQDLAYADGKCYAKGSAYEDLECNFDEEKQKYVIAPKNYERYRDAYYPFGNVSDEKKNEWLDAALKKFNDELVTVDGQNGEKLPTSAAYSLFIQYIKEFGLRFNNERILINSSIGGAQIDGFITETLDKALSKYAASPIEKQKAFDSKDYSSGCDFEHAFDAIQKDINSIDAIYPHYEQGAKYVKNVQSELNRHKSYTQEAAKNLEKAVAIYVKLTNEYTLKTRLLRMITLKEHCEIAYLMKLNTLGEHLDYKTAEVITNAVFEYFDAVPRKLLTIKNALIYDRDKIKEILDEGGYSKG